MPFDHHSGSQTAPVDRRHELVGNGHSAFAWILSGSSPQDVRDQAQRLHEHVDAHSALTPGEVGGALATRDAASVHRAAVVGSDRAQLQQALAAMSRGEPDPRVVRGTARPDCRPVLVFPGQGWQWAGMAAELAASSPEFAAQLQECDAALRPYLGFSAVDAVVGGRGGSEALSDVESVQCSMWAIMVSLARLWQSYGVTPGAVVGHSQGEAAAAVAVGALSLDDGARIVARYAQLIRRRMSGGGAMAAVGLPEAQVRQRLAQWGDLLWVAVVNSPSSTVVSGDPEALQQLLEACQEEGAWARRIGVDYAAHSPYVEPARQELREAFQGIRPQRCHTPFYSTVTGGSVDSEALGPEYWVDNLRKPIRFDDTVRTLLSDGYRCFVEVSAHPVLSMSMQETFDDAGVGASTVGSLRRDDGSQTRLLAGVAKAWSHGVDVDWSAAVEGAADVALPDEVFGSSSQEDAATAQARDRMSNASGPLSHLDRNDPAEQRRLLLDLVRRHTAAVLGHSHSRRVADDVTFRDAGLDSPRAVELCNNINMDCGLRLSAVELFSYPTPAALVERMRNEALGETADETFVTPPYARGSDRDPVAVVGMGCRFPGGVESPEGLWRLVDEGVDAVGPFPRDRGWDLAAIYDPDGERPRSSYVDQAGFLEGAAEFDAGFFGISPREALAMDPQQRLMLETSWEALEHAGVNPANLRGSTTGVFVGSIAQEYGSRLDQAPEGFEGQVITGAANSVAAGRVSYVLGLEGPAMTVDTACSSSLTALHLAVQSLRSGESDFALAGGVTVMANPGMFLEFSRQRGLAPDGRCKSFAASADGTNWAEGVGVLALQRLSDARRDGREVLAVVRGSAINQDGASNGLAAPNGQSQVAMIRRALADARLDPADVDVVEAHGTGTVLGDPIEAQALLGTYGRGRGDAAPLFLGSLKSNIGHAQAAAGVGGVIKMVMALREGVLPRTLHVDEPSGHVDWSSGGVELLGRARVWPEVGRLRRAGVSAFGISGSNAHVILEQHDEPAPAQERSTVDGTTPWVLSGKNESALRGQARRLRERLRQRPQLSGADVGFSLAATRTSFGVRAAVVAADRDGALEGLEALADDVESPAVVRGAAMRHDVGPVFVFPGQGAQWRRMGLELAEAFPAFDAALRECEAALKPHVDWSLREVLDSPLQRVDQVQPASWAVMVALARLWESFGVVPAAVVGHSQGEIAAATAAGALRLEDAAQAVVLRSSLIRQELAGHGAMASLSVGVAEATGIIADWDGRICVAAENGPSATVVSGDAAAVQELSARCEQTGVRARRLPVDYASHSVHVESIKDKLCAALGDVRPGRCRVPFYSTVVNEAIDGAKLDAEYWYRNLRQTVRFESAVHSLLADGHSAFIEMSSHPVLTMGVEEAAEADGVEVAVNGSVHRDDGGPQRFLSSVAEAWARGVQVDWREAFPGGRAVDLPTYAFQRQRYWLDAGPPSIPSRGHPLVESAAPLAESDGAVLSAVLSQNDVTWLADHAVAGEVLFPGAGFAELALHAGDVVGWGRVEELTLQQPLAVPEAGEVQLQVAVNAPDGDGADAVARRRVAVYSKPTAAAAQEPWTCHAVGVLAPTKARHAPVDDFGMAQWPPAQAEPVDVSHMYAAAARLGYEYGPSFQGVTAAWRRDGELFVDVALPQERHAEAARHGMHPALLDAALHGFLIDHLDEPDAKLTLPFTVSGMDLYAEGADSARVRLTPNGPDALRVRVADCAGRPVAEVESLTLQAARSGGPSGDAAADCMFTVEDETVEASAQLAGDAWRMLAPGESATSKPGPFPGVVVAPVHAHADAGVQETVLGVLRTVQEWLGDERSHRSRLVLALSGEASICAAVAGLVRSAQAEHPGRLGLVHAEEGLGDVAARRALAAVAAGEPEVRLRDGQATAPRLRRMRRREDLVGLPGQDWHVDVTAGGGLDSLAAAPAPAAAEPLSEGQVRVRVEAAGLNFHDVVVATGLTPPGTGGVGFEAAGTVVETGPRVTGVAVGDRVMGLLPSSLGTTAVGDVRGLAPLPSGWTSAQGASAPVAYLTSWMGLVDLANVRPGERVLIHTDAGGVGLAAIQVARYIGAEVFATASPAEQHMLRALGLSDDHIASSRPAEFRERFLSLTDDAGMDVVLNTLSGELTEASLDMLPEGGRFVELGKTDLRDSEEIAASRPGVQYRHFDLESRYPDVDTAWRRVAALLVEGALRPPQPTAWPISRAREAFALMQHAQHRGKIVLTVPRQWDAEGTVLITGGTGTLGRQLARHLVTAHGARRLLLTSRSGPQSEGAATLQADLEALGAEVRIVSCDVGDRAAVRRLLADVPQDRPLTAVIHAAGVLDDATVESLTAAQTARVLNAKAESAAHLDALTADMPLDAFVMFSSIAGVVGTEGQANYAAASSYLDELARDRRRRGLPAVSVAWGLWGQASGMTGHLSASDVARLSHAGVAALDADAALELFDAALGGEEPVVVAARMDMAGLREQAESDTLPAVFRRLVAAPVRRYAAADAPADGGSALQTQLANSTNEERDQVLTRWICERAAVILRLGSGERVGAHDVFREVGFDSLTAVELRNRVNAATGLRLPSTVAFRHPSPAELAARVREEMFDDEAKADGAALVHQLDQLRESVAAVAVDDDGRAAVAQRLRALLREVDAGPSGVADLEGATDDEMFALIDDELGGK